MENLHFLRYTHTHTDTHTYGYYIIRIYLILKVLMGFCLISHILFLLKIVYEVIRYNNDPSWVVCFLCKDWLRLQVTLSCQIKVWCQTFGVLLLLGITLDHWKLLYNFTRVFEPFEDNNYMYFPTLDAATFQSSLLVWVELSISWHIIKLNVWNWHLILLFKYRRAIFERMKECSMLFDALIGLIRSSQ